MKGIYTALVTPFYGTQLDIPSFRNLLKLQEHSSVEGIVLLGTTSESPTLTKEECTTIIELAKEEFHREIILGISENSLNKVFEKMAFYDSFAPAAYLICAPFYNKITKKGILFFYQEIAKKSHYPILLYNVPSRTGYDIPYEEVKLLSKNPKIIGIKNASDSLKYASSLACLETENFKIFSGNDESFFTTLKISHGGLISVLSNLIPNFIHKIYENISQKSEQAQKDFSLLIPLFSFLSSEVNPVPIKALMSAFHLIKKDCRIPLSALENHYDSIIDTLIEKNKEVFNECFARR